MIEHRYICTNCLMGWHETPYCPFPRQPQEPRYRYIIPAEKPFHFRWLLLAAFVFFTLLVLAILLHR